MKNPAFVGAAGGAALAVATQDALGEVLKSVIGVFEPAHADVGMGIGAAVYVVGGAACFCGLRRMLQGASASFWQSTLGRWLIGRAAGTLVFAALLKPAWMLSFFFLQLIMKSYMDVFGFASAMQLMPVWLVLLYGSTLAIAVRSRRPAKILIGKGSRPLRQLYRMSPMGRGGSSGFAGLVEEWANPWKPGMILLGASMYDRHWLVGVKDDRHMITASMTGGGKGRSAILPALITYPGSVLCIDVKGQNAAVSARARQKRLKQKVRIVAPMGASEGLEDLIARYNPLAALDPEAPDYTEQVGLIADALVMPGGDKSQFWDQSARTVIAGAIDYVVRTPDEKLPLLLEDRSREGVQ